MSIMNSSKENPRFPNQDFNKRNNIPSSSHVSPSTSPVGRKSIAFATPELPESDLQFFLTSMQTVTPSQGIALICPRKAEIPVLYFMFLCYRGARGAGEIGRDIPFHVCFTSLFAFTEH